MPRTLYLNMEISGCPTACLHCWANGRAYPLMPLVDIDWVLEQGKRFCADRDLIFAPYAFHELLAHPDVTEILPRFAALDREAFEPLATTGVPLAMRDDWRDILTAIGRIGTKTLWFTFHGIDTVHDRVVNRKGAYQEVCLAVARAHEAGFRCGCNVFVTKENLAQFELLVQSLHDMEIDEMGWEIARYHPTQRRRKSEVSRPELADFGKFAPAVAELSVFWREKWRNLPEYTEAAYVAQALQSQDSDAQVWQFLPSADPIGLVCRGNLDVYSGRAGYYERFHGNLCRDGVEVVFQSALERGAVSDDAPYFSTEALPTVQDLAAKVGDAQGGRIYFSALEMRQRWLDVALPEYRRY